ncbi:MAG TPA: hypothetical protein VND65_10505 [Candidatus Binatia bacterium]|nr:hypothetical protein [Candidatus Binatia bacterium]
MGEGESSGVGKELNLWVQTAGIVLAAAWGVYTFIYTQVIVPKAAPVNISVDLGLKKIDTAKADAKADKRHLVPVEMKISAKNPSSREVFLLPSGWIAWGLTIGDSGTQKADGFDEPKPITAQTSTQSMLRHADVKSVDVVAFGRLLEDSTLKPNEACSRTIVFYVPRDQYDSLEVHAYIPTVIKEGKVDLEWKLENSDLHASMYRLDGRGNRAGALKPDSDGGFSDPQLGLQQATSMTELSLWQ